MEPPDNPLVSPMYLWVQIGEVPFFGSFRGSGNLCTFLAGPGLLCKQLQGPRALKGFRV